MCFSLQRRAIFGHLNFKKVVRTRQFFSILTWKCASRFSRVQCFHIPTSKSGPSLSVLCILTWKCASRFSRAQCFHIPISKSGPNLSVLCILTWKCASRSSSVQFFISPLKSYLRTRRFTEPTFRPSGLTNHWKTQHLATFLTFRASVSSFFWLSRDCIFFLLTLLLFYAFHLLTLLLCSAFSTVHIVGS